MVPQSPQQIRADLDLIDRFAHSYQQQFASLIQELNSNPTPQTARHCLHLCVEAVNMLLTTQNQLASALRHLNHEAQS